MLIIRCFQSRDPNLLITAFCVLFRPILEHNSVVWRPMLKQEIRKIECVQRCFTKKLHGLHKMIYSDRLISLGIDSLYCRRVKADLLICYNILTNRVYA